MCAGPDVPIPATPILHAALSAALNPPLPGSPTIRRRKTSELMRAYDNDRPRRKPPALLFLLAVLVAGLIAAAIHFRPRFESQPPQIRLAPDAAVIGAAPLEITVLDAGAGLKSLSITLAAGGPQTSIAAEQF